MTDMITFTYEICATVPKSLDVALDEAGQSVEGTILLHQHRYNTDYPIMALFSPSGQALRSISPRHGLEKFRFHYSEEFIAPASVTRFSSPNNHKICWYPFAAASINKCARVLWTCFAFQ
jgi:hypothetical protein